MRVGVVTAILAIFLAAKPASAATIVVFTNPETMESRTIVVDDDGPDRIFLCMLPPGEAGCHRVQVKRKT